MLMTKEEAAEKGCPYAVARGIEDIACGPYSCMAWRNVRLDRGKKF